jgi:hypothetical protein
MRRITGSDSLSDTNLLDGLPRWKNSPEVITQIKSVLSESGLTDKDCVVLDVFSNMVFTGTSPDGIPVQAFQDEEGLYHIEGSLDVAPDKALSKVANVAADIIEAAGPALILIMLPVPRYIVAPCCNDEKHVENFCDTSYTGIFSEAAAAVIKAVNATTAKHNKKVDFLAPMSIFGGDNLKQLTTSAGDSVWRDDDAVHLAPEAYDDLATTILGVWRSADNTGRRRIDSMVLEDQQERRGGRTGQFRGGVAGGRGGRWGPGPASGTGPQQQSGPVPTRDWRGGRGASKRFNPY